MDPFEPITGRSWDDLTRAEYWTSIRRQRDPVPSPLSPAEHALAEQAFLGASRNVLEERLPSVVWAGATAIIAAFTEPYRNN